MATKTETKKKRKVTKNAGWENVAQKNVARGTDLSTKQALMRASFKAENIFVAEYAKDFDSVRAAHICMPGLAQWEAKEWAETFLGRSTVRDKLAHAAGVPISAERLLAEAAKIAYANLDDFLEAQEDGTRVVRLGKCSREQLAALQEFSSDEYVERSAGGSKNAKQRTVKRQKIKLASKIGAIELIGKHLKLWTDRTEVDASDRIIEILNAGRLRLAQAGRGHLIETTAEPCLPSLPPPQTNS